MLDSHASKQKRVNLWINLQQAAKASPSSLPPNLASL